MSNLEAIVDFGTKNLKLGVFDEKSKIIYSSQKKIIHKIDSISIEQSLSILIRNAEKYLSTHIDNIVVLYDSPKFYSLDISIKKVFDHPTLIKKVYETLIEEAHFYVAQNNFKDEIIHLVINNILVDQDKKLDKISDDIQSESLILEIKFICLSKSLMENISNKFKKINLKISNLYCSSYVKTISYNKKFDKKNYLIFLDIGYERTSCLIFNNNNLEFFKSIPLGSNNITKDISQILKINFENSEDLKIKFDVNENNSFLGQSDFPKINQYSEIIKKNISIDVLKEIIIARIEEIMELVVFRSYYIKNLNSSAKIKLVVTGGGSKLLSHNFNLNINKLVSEITFIDENDVDICIAGLEYFKSDESFHIKKNKKAKNTGFFETFFNLFSK